MRVLLAGATGAIGRPLTRALVKGGHEVLALARRESTAVEALGAQPIMADAMDREGLLRALDGVTADAVIHELTALSKPRRKLDEKEPSTLLRTVGTTHLLEAAKAIGAGRFLTQSMALGYGYRDHGQRVLTEDDPFGTKSGNVADVVVDGLISTEGQTFSAAHVEGVALRYGLFYGPGTWFDPTPGARPFPVPTGGGGVAAWIHVEDAAAATVAALERGRGGEPYNIVDDQPATWGEVAAAARGGRALALPGWLLKLAVPYLKALMVDTSIRVSHAKASQELGWTPVYPSFREGLRAG